MPKITKVKGGFNIQHTTREVWGVDDPSEKATEPAKFGTYTQVEAQATEKAQREGVDVPIYRTKSGRYTLVRPAQDGPYKIEPHGTIAAPTQPAPMADERETAQWFMSNGISMDDARKLFAAEVPDAQKRCYRFGSMAAWAMLPIEAKDALRRKLAQVRADSAKYEREVLGRNTETPLEALEATAAALDAFRAATAIVAVMAEKMVERLDANQQWTADEHAELKRAIATRRAKHEAFAAANARSLARGDAMTDTDRMDAAFLPLS